MTRIQPVLTPTELALVDKMAELTGSKRTEVIKSALAVYQWFVRQAITGNRVIARKPSGEEIGLHHAGNLCRSPAGDLQMRGGIQRAELPSRVQGQRYRFGGVQ